MFSRLSKIPNLFMLKTKGTIGRKVFLPNFHSTNQNFQFATAASALKFQNDVKKNEFYVLVDGQKAFVQYRVKGKLLELLHTIVPESLGGRGIAKYLAKETFEYVAKNNLKMQVHCDFLQSYLEKQGQEYKKYLV